MKRRITIILFIALGLPLLFGFGPIHSTASKLSSTSTGGQLHPNTAYGKLPLAFESNQGQTDAQVQFLCRGQGYEMFLTSTQATLVLRYPISPATSKLRQPHGPKFPKGEMPSFTTDVIQMKLKSANEEAPVDFQDLLPGISNYFIGKDPSKWRTNIPHYGKVRATNVYDRINLEYYGHSFDGAPDGAQDRLEHDFVVSPGADPRVIQWVISGADLEIDGQGNLVLTSPGGKVVLRPPLCYQGLESGRRTIECRYVFAAKDLVGFDVGTYDHSRTLVIDPILVYSTYVGGNYGDGANGIAVDASGNAYVTGFTSSANYPTTAGTYQAALGGVNNAFVTKLDPTGTALVYSTYLGGSSRDWGQGIAVDASGNVYVTGFSYSTDFPTTAGAFQTAFGAISNAFITKLNPTGTALVYSTYLGGTGGDWGYGIAVNPVGNAYVTGYSQSPNFPITPGVYQTVLKGANAYITELKIDGSGLVYSTFLGGSVADSGTGIALDSGGNAYVTGYTDSNNFPTTPGAFQAVYNCPGLWCDTGFAAKLNPTGTGLVYSTYLGGSMGTGGSGIAVDGSGNAYVTGNTVSSDFPTTLGAYQTIKPGPLNAFMTELSAAGSALVYSTYLGGNSGDEGNGIALDPSGNIDVTGSTSSSNFPTTAGAYQANFGGTQDAFMAQFSPSGAALVYSTYLGGSGDDIGYGIASDPSGNIYVAGLTGSTNFPTTAGVFQPVYGNATNGNAFVAKFASAALTDTPTATPALTATLTPSLTPTLTFTITPTFTPTQTYTPTCQTHAWPDPYNPNYAIGGTMKMSCLPAGTTVSFYTVSGELVRTVPENGGMSLWDGHNQSGAWVSPGVYYYVIQKGNQVLATGKFLVINNH